MMQTVADRPQTRLLKTKTFVEQLVVQRKKNGPPGAWGPPTSQTGSLDDQVSDWVDQTGNEIVAAASPSMFMQWMDAERTMRLVIATMTVTYVPAIAPVKPITEIADERTKPTVSGWEPVV